MVDLLTPEVHEIALSLMAGLSCPRSLTVAILVRYREWEQLLNMKCNPSDYAFAADYHRAVSATDFLRKMDTDIGIIDTEKATFEKWLESEKACFHTNCKFNEIMDFGTLFGNPVHNVILEFIEGVRKNLLYLIGSGPDPLFEGKFGPGATASDDARRCTVLHKLSSTPTLYPSTLPYLVPWTGTKWAGACASRGDDVVTIRGNTYFSVPKTALIRRPCAKEASINGYYQLGLGRELKRRLKDRGLDLKNGQCVHTQVACSSSITGEHCTIDLSSASDTISSSLVKMICPRGWFNHLSDLRAPYTRVGKAWYKLEKFSSMGNGFTFELETAIFAAITMTACPGYQPGAGIWVYGDDIICPSGHARDVMSALKFFGFTPNPRKTFLEGPFRESCGGDFYLGEPVRASFLERNPYEPQHYITLANQIRRLGRRSSGDKLLPDVLSQGRISFSDIRRAWFKCLDNIPVHIRSCRGPEALGDLVIQDSEDRWSIRWRSSGIRYLRCYRPASWKGVSLARFDSDVQFAGALYGIRLFPQDPPKGRSWPLGFDNREVLGRECVQSYKVGWVPFS